MIKYDEVRIIKDSDWDKLITTVYGRPYCYQQQDDCRDRGIEYLPYPCEHDFKNDTIPIEVNGLTRGVSFKAWLEKDPNEKFFDGYQNILFWERNFYPHVSMILDDLYKRELMTPGKYALNIDW